MSSRQWSFYRAGRMRSIFSLIRKLRRARQRKPIRVKYGSWSRSSCFSLAVI